MTSLDKLKTGWVRQKQKVLQKMGKAEATIDPLFDEEAVRFKQLDQLITKLYKDLKGYLDSLRALCASSNSLSTDIVNFYDENCTLALASLEFRDVQTDIDSKIRKGIDDKLIEIALEPLGRYLEEFRKFKVKIDERNKRLLDYDAQRTKTEKLKEKPSDDPTRLPRNEAKLEEFKKLFEELNNQLRQDLGEFYAKRNEVIDPAFNVLMTCQLQYYNEVSQVMTKFDRWIRQ